MARTPSPFSAIAAAVPTWPGPSWLTDTRKAALDRFGLAGLPTPRLEGWRTSPLPDLSRRAFFPASGSSVDGAQVLVQPFNAGDPITLVFVDGFHSAALSSPKALWPKGVSLASMSELLALKPEDLRPWLSGHRSVEGAMHDLNTAAFRDGASIEVEDGIEIPVEVRIVVVSTSTDQPVAQHIRNRIVLGKGSRLRMMMAVIGSKEAQGFANNHTTLSMAEGSRLDLVRVHESPIGVPHFDALTAALGAHAMFADTVLQTGPSWTRSEIEVTLSGEHAAADLSGVFVARGVQTSDIHTILLHEAPGVTSRQNYRGLATDQARGVFHGQIKVGPDARGADATQSNKNMLLSRRAQVHSTPGLEILTDDVKCKHGSATGQIDQAQLFYLRSRGIESGDATRILTRAFAAEIVERVTGSSARELVEGQIAPSLEALGAAA